MRIHHKAYRGCRIVPGKCVQRCPATVRNDDDAGSGVRDATRRSFLRQTGAALLGVTIAPPCALAVGPGPAEFRLWATSDSHVGTDLKKGRESLADAIRQSEQDSKDGGPGFDWDIAIHAGDFSGNQGSPQDDEGREVIRQFAALRKHRREQFYCVAGNHDATLPNEKRQWWFRKWVDPAGENTTNSGVDPRRRPYPIEGTWERYSFRVGNLLFLMMSDRNDTGPPVGRGQRGGYPAGAVTSETFEWWRSLVQKNRDRIIISVHHHMLRETTIASGPWEGFTKDKHGKWSVRYHGHYPDGGPKGASYLYFLDDKPDAHVFEQYLAAHPGAIDLWLGGHTHAKPDDRVSRRSHVERKWNVHFVNIAALTRFHGAKHSMPMSRLLTFTEGSRRVRIQCYLHTSEYAPQGWYDKAECTVELGKPFRLRA